MNAFDLMALAEGATGFQGGAAVDSHPYLTLSEATAELPVMIMQEQCEFHAWSMNQNEVLTEAAVSAFTTGSKIDVSAMAEASVSGIVNKIKSVFARIKKFLGSIVAKLKLHIDKIRMTGSQLYARYKNDPRLKGKDFKNMKFTGYKFEKDIPFQATDTYLKNVDGLLSKAGGNGIMTPSQFSDELNKDGANQEALKKRLTEMEDLDTKTRTANFATELVGKKVGENWRADITDELWGEKVDLTYGTDYTIEGVTATLSNPLNLKGLTDGYEAMLNAVNANERQVQASADALQKVIDKGNADNNAAKINALASEYYSAYLKIYTDLTGTITAIQDIRVKYETARYNQNKEILVKMMSYKGDTASEDASADADEFDFELM